MLQLAQACDRASVEELARQVHMLRVTWRPDIYEMAKELYPLKRFQDAVAARELYVAKLSDVVIGYVHIKSCLYDCPGVVKRKVMQLDEIMIHEYFRNQGYGTMMMDDVKALARAFGCTDLQVAVYPQNDAAIAFFQKNGLMIQSINMQMKL